MIIISLEKKSGVLELLNFFLTSIYVIYLFFLYDSKEYSLYIFIFFLYFLNIFLACLLKILVNQIKKAIFKQNICLIMNLKERGITVGDLLIILIIIITSTILIKSFSKDKKTTYNYSNQEQVTYKKGYYQKLI